MRSTQQQGRLQRITWWARSRVAERAYALITLAGATLVVCFFLLGLHNDVSRLGG